MSAMRVFHIDPNDCSAASPKLTLPPANPAAASPPAWQLRKYHSFALPTVNAYRRFVPDTVPGSMASFPAVPEQ